MPRTSFSRHLIAVLSVAAVIVFASSSSYAAPPVKTKPQLPVRIEIAPAEAALKPQNIKPGDIVRLRITAAAMTEADEVRITVEPYDGAELVSGSPSWSGKTAKGERKELVIGVRAPADGTGKVKATISVFRDGRQIMQRVTRYFLGGEPAGPGGLPAGAVIKKDAKGRDIVEY